MNTSKHRLIPPQVAAGMNRQELRAARRMGWVPALAGGDGTSLSQPDPFGLALSGSALTVDDYVNPPTRIPAIIRSLVSANEGYWIETVFRTPGFTVEGGAILATETFPEDHFLDPAQTIAPRAPGSEAPRLGIKGRAPKMYFPESWSGSIEVTDEARRRNQVLQVQDSFTKAGNTFADRLQSRGEEALQAFTTASGRTVTAGSGTFGDWNAADPIYNFTSTDPRPAQEFARVKRLFSDDKVGIQPDVVIVASEDAEQFDRIYEDRGDALLARYGLRMQVSTRLTSGVREYVKSQAVGVIAFEKPLGTPEKTREGTRFTDVFTMEVVPVFVPYAAEAILQVNGVAAS